MKEIKPFKVGCKIPDNARFLSHDSTYSAFYYEIPIIKEKKAPKERPNIEKEIDNIISCLNYFTGKRFSLSGRDTRKHVRARINDGHNHEDFKKVIIKKTADWLTDPKMNQYLRPSTLFSAKFESYLNATTGSEMKDDAFDQIDKALDGIDA